MSVFVEVFERSRNDRVVVVQILIGTVEEIQEMKEQIKVLTEKIGTLRKEAALCDGIAARSKVIEEKFKMMREEKEKKTTAKAVKISGGNGERDHLFPYRTQKLSLSAQRVLGWRRPGRVCRRRILLEKP